MTLMEFYRARLHEEVPMQPDQSPTPTFPVDDTTLDLVWSALHPEPEAERSSLYDLLELISDMHFGEAQRIEIEPDVYEIETTRWGPHDVISALVAEVRRLRAGKG